MHRDLHQRRRNGVEEVTLSTDLKALELVPEEDRVDRLINSAGSPISKTGSLKLPQCDMGVRLRRPGPQPLTDRT
jgi:hypothetical protein